MRAEINCAPVIVVTGAAGTLGRAISVQLAARATRLVLVDHDPASLERLRVDLRAAKSSFCVVADLTTDEGPGRVVKAALEACGTIDVLVNNAGIAGPIGPFEGVSIGELRNVFELNVFALARLTQAVIPALRQRGGGRIVNLASGAGLAGTPQMAAYSASKHAVVGLTRSVAVELAGSRISVNAVCPGCVDSPMMSQIEADLSQHRSSGTPQSFVPSIPAGRYAAPDEVANLVTYLALDAPTYLTGAALVIDGAMRA